MPNLYKFSSPVCRIENLSTNLSTPLDGACAYLMGLVIFYYFNSIHNFYKKEKDANGEASKFQIFQYIFLTSKNFASAESKIKIPKITARM